MGHCLPRLTNSISKDSDGFSFVEEAFFTFGKLMRIGQLDDYRDIIPKVLSFIKQKKKHGQRVNIIKRMNNKNKKQSAQSKLYKKFDTSF